MLRLEGKRINNPLVYEKIKYPSHEWDNIPPVIPRFIIQLEKYMSGLTAAVKTQSELETVASLRAFTEGEVQSIDGRLKDAGKERVNLKAHLTGEINTVDKFANGNLAEFNKYRDSLLYTKSCATDCETEEDGIAQTYENFILEECKPVQESETGSAMKTFHVQCQDAVLQPRLISLKGFQNIFDLALHNSELRQRQDDTDEEIAKLKQEIGMLKVRDMELKNHIDANKEEAAQALKASEQK